MKTVGIVLAGGLSSRYGSPKAFARLDNKYFYEYAVEALAPSCEEVLIVTREELLERFPSNVLKTTDLPEVRGNGPLAGILTGMKFKKADRYIVMPCDTPFVTESIIKKLLTIHRKDVTTVVVDERIHPLISIWDYSVKSLLQEALRENEFKVMSILKRVETTFIEGRKVTNQAELAFLNINKPTDLERS